MNRGRGRISESNGVVLMVGDGESEGAYFDRMARLCRSAGIRTWSMGKTGPIADVSTLQRTVERISAMGGSAVNLRYLMESGTSFVIPGKRQTKCVKTLMSELIKVKDSPDRVMVHGDTVYSVIEAEVAIVPKRVRSDPDTDETNDTGEWELVLSEDPRFAEVPESMRMTAHACFDAKGAAEERDKMQKALKGIETKLRSMDPWVAFNGFRDVAGDMPSSSTSAWRTTDW